MVAIEKRFDIKKERKGRKKSIFNYSWKKKGKSLNDKPERQKRSEKKEIASLH